MSNDPDMAWFVDHTSNAPEALRARSERFFNDTVPGHLVGRLARAGRSALAEATRDGAARAAALDLLAADALITLALVRAGEEAPARFGEIAEELRREVTTRHD